MTSQQKPSLCDHGDKDAKAQQIQRGLEPAETIPQLVDAVRQDVAGIGACVSSIRFIRDSRPDDVPQSIIEWLDRLAFHAERIVGFASGLNYADLAEITGTGTKSIDNALQRARTKLTEAMAA